MEYTINKFQYKDYATVIGMQFRAEDVREICTVASCCTTLENAAEIIAHDCVQFDDTYICKADGVAFAVVGTVPTDHPTVRVIWCVGTSLIAEGGVNVLIWSSSVVHMLMENCAIVENYVDSRNKVHMKWIKWMGFTYSGAYSIINGVKFHHFAGVKGGLKCVE